MATTRTRVPKILGAVAGAGVLLAPLAAFAAEDITLTESIDLVWLTVAAAMVFFMQAGFLCLEVGLVRPRNITMVALKNMVDWVAVSLAFLLLGFGVMFGPTMGSLFGGGYMMAAGLEENHGVHGYAFFMFQLAFCGAAATIVSGAMSERTGFVPYLACSLIIGLVIYPLFGHWVWGNLLIEDNRTLLGSIGFHDFAGSTVVHSLGGWIGLIGAWLVGPRIGRVDADGKVQPMRGYSIPFAVLGTFILWFGWWGFNGGSTLKVGSDVGLVILNTNIAAAAGGFTAFVHCWFVQDKQDINEKFIGGILGGLVAITACADIMDIGRALLIGLAAGVLHNLSYDVLLKKMRVDDPVGAVPVHLVCGIFGTMCVAVADPDILGRSNAQQFGIQMFGIAACMVWSVGCSLVMFVGLKTIIGLRVSPEEEVAGLNMEGETDDEIPADELEVDPEVIRRLMID